MKKFKFGQAFSEEMLKVSRTYKHFEPNLDSQSWQDSFIGKSTGNDSLDPTPAGDWKKIFFALILIIAFSGLFFRLFHLQVTDATRNRTLADSNRIKIRAIHAPRGVIYDRSGKILAQNEPGFRLVDDSGVGKTRYISRDEELAMEVSNDPSLSRLEIDNLRAYPFKDLTAHILGYVSEINADELKESEFHDYRSSDRIGRGGVEQIYEKVLRGVDGGEVVEVDAKGDYVRTLGKTDPIPGQNLYLSLDIDLQKVTFNNLKNGIQTAKVCCGAAIVQDPRNGQILALASIPSYNPDDLESALDQPDFPFLNRVIAGSYPPGSTFKIATALAGLNSGKIDANFSIQDTGVLNIGPYSYSNWYYSEYGRKEEGLINVVRALTRSNDIYFYQLGQLTGEKAMGEVAISLGFGQKLGIDLPGEITGLIPTDAWKQQTFDQVWYPGDTLHMAIGQGYVLVTPLQISNLISTVAASGQQFPPHLALKITSAEGRTLKEYKYDPSKVKYKDSDINLIKTGLQQVPLPGGTAWPFFTFPIQTAGKTGTAEFGPADKTHAWYTAYAPVNNPEVSVTVLVEGGGEGSNVASPVAKEIFRYYFSPDKKNLIKDLYTTASASTASDAAATFDSGARPIGE